MHKLYSPEIRLQSTADSDGQKLTKKLQILIKLKMFAYGRGLTKKNCLVKTKVSLLFFSY